MHYWILKTEPTTYSMGDLKRDGKTAWDGVRNYQARNNLASMKQDDRCFIYHSVGPKEIVGTARVVKSAYPDVTAGDPRWVCVDICFEKALTRPVKLEELKSHPRLKNISLVHQGRLSVSPISKADWDEIIALSSSHEP